MRSALLAFAAAAAVIAAPAPAAPAITDEDILQYALTLEHLESAFYSEAVAKFQDSDYASGGEQKALFSQIAGHEAGHVAFLQTVLGDKATKACNYSFPLNDFNTFKATAQVLEGVGVSAYLGAAASIKNPTYLTAAGSILTVEARHAAWLASTNGNAPWPGAYDTPLGFNQVYSLAAGFISSCPDSNPKLPVKAFPALSAQNATGLKSGGNVTFNVPGTVNGTDLYIAFLNGVTPATFLPYTANSSVAIPNLNATGTIYAIITKTKDGVTDDNTVAGPAVLMFDAGYPSGVSPGSSTGNGSGLPGGSNSGSGNGNGGNGGQNGTGAGSRTVASWSAAAFGLAAAFFALA